MSDVSAGMDDLYAAALRYHARDGFGRVLNGQHANVALSGTELRLTAGQYTLVFTSGSHKS
jgi:hypothetical protein